MKELNYINQQTQSVKSFIAQIISTSLNRKAKEENNDTNLIKSFADSIFKTVLQKERHLKKCSYKNFTSEIFSATISKLNSTKATSNVKNFITEIIHKTLSSNFVGNHKSSENTVKKFTDEIIKKALFESNSITRNNFDTKKFAGEIITSVICKQNIEKKFSYKKFVNKIFEKTLKIASLNDQAPVKSFVSSIINKTLKIYNKDMKTECYISYSSTGIKEIAKSTFTNTPFTSKIKQFADEIITTVILKCLSKDLELRRNVRFYVTEIFTSVLYSGKIKLHQEAVGTNFNNHKVDYNVNTTKLTEVSTKTYTYTTNTRIVNTVNTTNTVKGDKKQSVITKKSEKVEKIEKTVVKKTENKLEKQERKDKVENLDKNNKNPNPTTNSNTYKPSPPKKGHANNINGIKNESIANKVGNSTMINNVEIIEENGLNKEKVIINTKQTTLKSSLITNNNNSNNSNKANGARKVDNTKESFNTNIVNSNTNNKANKIINTTSSANNSNIKSSTFNKSNVIKTKIANNNITSTSTVTTTTTTGNNNNKTIEQVKKVKQITNPSNNCNNSTAVSTKHNKTQSIGFFVEEKFNKTEKNETHISSVNKTHGNSKSMIKSPSKPESIKTNLLSTKDNTNKLSKVTKKQEFNTNAKDNDVNDKDKNRLNSTRNEKYTTNNKNNNNNSKTVNNRTSSVTSRPLRVSTIDNTTTTNTNNTNISNRNNTNNEALSKSKTRTSQFNRTRVSKSNNFDMVPENNYLNNTTNNINAPANLKSMKTNSIANNKHSSSMEKIPKLNTSTTQNNNRKSSVTNRIKPANTNKYSIASLNDINTVKEIREVNENTIISNTNGDKRKEKRLSIVDRPYTCVAEKRVDTHLDLDALKKKLGRKSVKSGRASLMDPFSLKKIYVTYFSFFSVFFKPAFPLKHYFFYWKLFRNRSSNSNTNCNVNNSSN